MGILSRWWPRQRLPVVLPAVVAYDLWAPMYPAAAHNALMRAEQAIVEELLRPLRSRRALDVGTGTGRYLPLLSSVGSSVGDSVGAATGATMVVALDRSLAMLAEHHGPAPRVCADASRLPLRDAAFDLITAALMACDIADLVTWATELSRVLSPGGHLIYSDLHPSWAANHWRRTFRAADGREIEIPYVPHDLAGHDRAMRAAGLHVLDVREARLPYGSMPAVGIVFHAVKPEAGAA